MENDYENNPWSYLLSDKRVQAYFFVVGCAILKCAIGYQKQGKLYPSNQKSNVVTSLLLSPPFLSVAIIGVTWFYILRFILKNQFTSESYFDDAYKDVLQSNNLYFTSTQLLTWAIVAVIWTADESAHIGYLLFGFLGAMAASFVLWVPSSRDLNINNIISENKRRTLPIVYVLTSIVAFVCILNLRPCLNEDAVPSLSCSTDAGFGSFLPNFRYYLHGLHIILLLPIFITRVLRICQPHIDIALLYAALAVVFATWHVYQIFHYGATFAIPTTDCQKSITTDLVCCSGITLYAIYQDAFSHAIKNGIDAEIVRKRTLLAILFIPVISPAAVLAAHLCSCRFRASHMECIAYIQRVIARKMRERQPNNSGDHSKESASVDGWCNLGLWTRTQNYDKACESLALALAQSAGLSKNDTVLSCGCGSSGKELSLYKNHFQLRHITGIDPSINMEEKDSEALLYKKDFNIRKVRASVEELSGCTKLFPHCCFNTILALDNVYHYTNKNGFFKDCSNLLPPGGKVAVSDIILQKRIDSLNMLPMWVRAILFAMGVSNVWSEQEYRQKLSASDVGFINIKVERIGKQVFQGWNHLFPSKLFEYIDYAIIVAIKPESTMKENKTNGDVATEEKPKKKIAIIGSGMAGLSAAHSILSSSKSPDVSVDIYEANSRPGLAGATTLIGQQLIDVPPRMATKGYYKNYIQLLNDLRVPLSIIKSDCSYHIDDGCGNSQLFMYEKSDLSNLCNALFVGGLINTWKVMRAMSEIHNKWSGHPLKNNQEDAVNFSFGAWLHKHFHLYDNGEERSYLKQKSSNGHQNVANNDTTFNASTLANHENQYLSIIIGSLGWMLSCTYNQLFRCPADIMLSYIKGLRNSTGFLGLFNNDGEVARVIPSIKALENALLYGVDNLCFNSPVVNVDDKKVINGIKYDAIICATEASVVNKVVKDSSTVFSKFQYHPSTIYLHSDETFMPPNENSWRTWGVYMTPKQDEPQLTFWLNQFYPNATFKENVFQTWASVRAPQSEKVIKKNEFTRVLHTEESRSLVARVDAEQGKKGIYYAGSYAVYGMGLLEQALISGKNAGEKIMKDLFDKHEQEQSTRRNVWNES